ncbi:hypothetical protein [Helicobacter pylori]|nr:hypothetical protein [Helicobacter pylori]
MKIGWIGLGAMGTPNSQAEKSGLGALDMAAVYHYLEKGEH